MQPRILVADDQADILSALKLLLKREGFDVATASSPAGVLDIVAREPVDVALVDLNYSRDTTSGEEGVALVEQLQREHPELPVLSIQWHPEYQPTWASNLLFSRFLSFI